VSSAAEAVVVGTQVIANVPAPATISGAPGNTFGSVESPSHTRIAAPTA
jgi:hypothetical protein